MGLATLDTSMDLAQEPVEEGPVLGAATARVLVVKVEVEIVFVVWYLLVAVTVSAAFLGWRPCL